MIIVDTSVWIAANRKPRGSCAETLRALLDADEVALALPVRIELVPAAAKKDRPKLRRLLAALPLVVPTDDTWRLIESWAEGGHDAGYAFGIPDLLIAALANELGGLVWSFDSDFEDMEKLGFVRLYGLRDEGTS